MKKIREWLYNNFLPKETKEIYLREREVLENHIAKQEQTIKELNAYINGVHDVIRQRIRIEINNEVGK